VLARILLWHRAFLHLFLGGSGESRVLESTRKVLVVHAERRGSPCPSCEQHSDSPHSIYVRQPADLPAAGRSAQIELQVRRFRCRNARCTRHTSFDCLPELLVPGARRTHRLAHAQCSVGLTAGAKTGASLLKPVALQTRPDSLLRLMHDASLSPSTSPRVLGVDDWAYRKGRTDGSLRVDLEAHRVADLLPDRSSSTLTSWLRRHPDIEVFT
jgi:transposase